MLNSRHNVYDIGSKIFQVKKTEAYLYQNI